MYKILNNTKLQRFFTFLIYILPLIFIWQGGDLTDTGYNVTVYHFFFDRLNEGVTDSLIFLTQLTGGIWYRWLPFLGVPGIAILALIFYYANIFFSRKILLAVYPGHPLIPFFLLAGAIFSIRAFPFIFNYDLFSSFFFLCIIYIFRKNEHHFSHYFGAGLISLLLILTRFPNIFILLFFPVVLLILGFTRVIPLQPTAVLKRIIIYFSAVSIGFLIFLMVLDFTHTDKIFFNNLIDIQTLGSSESSAYNLTYVINKYLQDLLYFFLYFAATTFFFTLILFLSRRIESNVFLSALFLSSLLIISLYPFVFNYNNSVKYVVPALILLALFFSRPKNRVVFPAVLLGIFMIIQIAGSNTGIFLKTGLLTLTALPLSFLHLFHQTSSIKKNISLVSTFYTILLSLIIYLVFIYGLTQTPDIRLKAIYPIQLDKYRGTFTTKSQALLVERITKDVNAVKNSGQKLFILGHMPMMYYLTDMAPAHKEFWLIGNNIGDLNKILKEISNDGELPLILNTHEGFMKNDTIIIEDFLQNHYYRRVKDSDSYDIWQINSK